MLAIATTRERCRTTETINIWGKLTRTNATLTTF
jgi:hypothetical protein